MTYPRVLVISAAALNSQSATGMTMANLLHGWPLDRIAQVYWDNSIPDPEHCNRYWVISHGNAPLVNGIRRIVQTLKSKRNLLKSSPQITIASPPSSQMTGRKFFAPGFATGWADTVNVRLSDEFWQWIDDFNPEVIYSVLGSIRIMNIVLQVSKRLSIPVVPHFMDDWPNTLYHSEAANWLPRQILQSSINKVLKKSSHRMVISDAMAEEFKSRYHLDFKAFMNCVDTKIDFSPVSKSEDSLISFGYVGGLHLNRWKSLQQVADALLQLKDNGNYVELTVFAPVADIQQYGHILSENPVVRLGGSLSPVEVMSALSMFDVLVHIESFDEQDCQYTRLSISTKIPQYMTAAKPILAYGPADVASCKYIGNKQCGVVVGDRDIDSLVVAIRSLVESSDLREQLGMNGRNTAMALHSADIERERFRNILFKSAVAIGQK